MNLRLACCCITLMPTTLGFSPLLPHSTITSSTSTVLHQSAEPKETVSARTDQWIKNDLETKLNQEVIVGPDQVIIYDTTLRGMYRNRMCRVQSLVKHPFSLQRDLSARHRMVCSLSSCLNPVDTAPALDCHSPHYCLFFSFSSITSSCTQTAHRVNQSLPRATTNSRLPSAS